ncbi:MAG TPA: ATP-grasp domain-containing protein [Pyrinomonadaceae bacterium]|nr:ATP-grasp domain-containing protein [Pyrinomonadaceae bacterium]
MTVAAHDVGIFGRADDPQVARVAAYLGERGARPRLFDLGGFPARLRLALEDGAPRAGGEPLPAASSWYVRSMPMTMPFFDFDPRVEAATPAELLARWRRRYAAERERQSFITGFVLALGRAGARLVNPPPALDQHFVKTEQLERLRAAGLPVPRTLATNDPAALLRFAEDFGPLVYKPLAGGALCRRVEPEDLEGERLAALARAPVLFQEEVRGRDVRVYVAGGRVAAAYEILSDEVDYRGSEKGVAETGLSEAEAEAAVRAARACEMLFTGLDLKRRGDGSFAVLECNPSPMFAGIEKWTKRSPVTAALGDLLLAPL